MRRRAPPSVVADAHKPVRPVWESPRPVREGGPGGKYRSNPATVDYTRSIEDLEVNVAAMEDLLAAPETGSPLRAAGGERRVTQELEDMAARVRAAKTEAQEARREADHCQELIARLRKQLTDQTHSIQDASSGRVAKLEAQLAAERERAAKATADLRRSQTRASAATRDLRMTRRDVESLEESFVQFKLQKVALLGEMRSQADKFEAELEAERARVREALRARDEARALVGAMQQEATGRISEVSAAREAAEHAQACLIRQLAAVRARAAEQAERREQRCEADVQQAVERTIDEARIAQARLSAQLGEAQDRLEAAEAEARELRRQDTGPGSAAEKALRELAAAYSSSSPAAVATPADGDAPTTAELEQALKLAKRHKARGEDLEARLSSAQAQIGKLKRRVQRGERAYNELELLHADLRAQLQNARTDALHLQQEATAAPPPAGSPPRQQRPAAPGGRPARKGGRRGKNLRGAGAGAGAASTGEMAMLTAMNADNERLQQAVATRDRAIADLERQRATLVEELADTQPALGAAPEVPRPGGADRPLPAAEQVRQLREELARAQELIASLSAAPQEGEGEVEEDEGWGDEDDQGEEEEEEEGWEDEGDDVPQIQHPEHEQQTLAQEGLKVGDKYLWLRVAKAATGLRLHGYDPKSTAQFETEVPAGVVDTLGGTASAGVWSKLLACAVWTASGALGVDEAAAHELKRRSDAEIQRSRSRPKFAQQRATVASGAGSPSPSSPSPGGLRRHSTDGAQLTEVPLEAPVGPVAGAAGGSKKRTTGAYGRGKGTAFVDQLKRNNTFQHPKGDRAALRELYRARPAAAPADKEEEEEEQEEEAQDTVAPLAPRRVIYRAERELQDGTRARLVIETGLNGGLLCSATPSSESDGAGPTYSVTVSAAEVARVVGDEEDVPAQSLDAARDVAEELTLAGGALRLASAAAHDRPPSDRPATHHRRSGPGGRDMAVSAVELPAPAPPGVRFVAEADGDSFQLDATDEELEFVLSTASDDLGATGGDPVIGTYNEAQLTFLVSKLVLKEADGAAGDCLGWE